MLLNIDAAAPAVPELERQMRLNEDIVRHLTVRVEELQEGPSAMMQSRASRDDRPRREDRFGDRPPRGDREDRFGDRPPRGDRGERRPFGEDEAIIPLSPAAAVEQE
jgi:small subunit ribosomal protein S6